MGLFGKKKVKDTFQDIFIIAGLDVPENCPCVAKISDGKLILDATGKQFVLSIDKIIDIKHTMDVNDVQYTKNGSIVKGMAGAAVFGVAGAIVGGAPKTKTKREVTGGIIISYKSTNDIMTIVLAGKVNTLDCAALCDTLKPMINVRSETIEL